jgi:DNA-binding response OmpR family regulator
MSRVLVVDDEPALREILRAYIEREGHQVVEAGTIHDARAILKKEIVDLIFLDLVLPDESGLPFCQELKIEPKTAAIPVVILTSLDTSDDLRHALGSGAELFAAKPVNKDRIHFFLSELLGREA